jgi:hypothetical protein
MGKNKLRECPLCKRPTILMENEDKPREYQGPSTHPKIKGWCTGLCESISVLVYSARNDVKIAAKELKTKEAKAFAKKIYKHFDWLYNEICHDLKIAAKEV